MGKRRTLNQIRADKARAALKVATDNDTPETDIIDLLSYLMLVCEEEKLSFRKLLARAGDHVEAERTAKEALSVIRFMASEHRGDYAVFTNIVYLCDGDQDLPHLEGKAWPQE